MKPFLIFLTITVILYLLSCIAFGAILGTYFGALAAGMLMIILLII